MAGAMEPPVVRHGFASYEKKGEDRWLNCTFAGSAMGLSPNRGESRVSDLHLFAIFDGHNGGECAEFMEKNYARALECALRKCVQAEAARSTNSAIGDDEARVNVIQQALTQSFVTVDTAYNARRTKGGTTATVILIDGWVVHVANVGDSLASLDTGKGHVHQLAYNFRVEVSTIEQKRLAVSGAQTGRLLNRDGDPVGPMRVWPGGLCLSRAIGDIDVGECILAKPHLGAYRLTELDGGTALENGCRIILASDGMWETQGYVSSANRARGINAQQAASKIASHNKVTFGNHDDLSIFVVDIFPENMPVFQGPRIERAQPACGLPFFASSAGMKVSAVRRVEAVTELPDYMTHIDNELSAELSRNVATDKCVSAAAPSSLREAPVVVSSRLKAVSTSRQEGTSPSTEDPEEQNRTRKDAAPSMPHPGPSVVKSARNPPSPPRAAGQPPRGDPAWAEETMFERASREAKAREWDYGADEAPPSHEGTHHLGNGFARNKSWGDNPARAPAPMAGSTPPRPYTLKQLPQPAIKSRTLSGIVASDAKLHSPVSAW